MVVVFLVLVKWFRKVLMNRSEGRNAAASLSLFIVRLYCSILFKLILLLWLFYGRFKRRGRKKRKRKETGEERKEKRGAGGEGGKESAEKGPGVLRWLL